MVSSLPMRRCLHRHRNGVVALVAMALLSLPMRRCLAVVLDDGDSAAGNSIDNNCNSATNVNNDGNGVTDDDIDDNNCNGQRLQ